MTTNLTKKCPTVVSDQKTAHRSRRYSGNDRDIFLQVNDAYDRWNRLETPESDRRDVKKCY